MSRFQNITFNDISDLMAYLPHEERRIMEVLRSIILDCIPQAREKLAYNVPYYYLHSRVCFLWPSAVPWGKVRPGGVMMGFCNGHLLRDEINYLEKEKRRKVYSKTFHSPAEIDAGLLKSYIFEAAMVDKAIRESGKTKRQ